MNANAQQIAIAQWCGWKVVITETAVLRIRHIEYSKDGIVGNPPDYLNDLNAIHEAVATLQPDIVEYLVNLQNVVYSENRFEIENRFALVNATAAQRSEALLRTLNLWKD